jgi:PAS domain S-box-containing protein
MVNNGFSSSGALSVFVDREQNVWFPNARGVDKISSLLVHSFFEENGLLDNEVSAIIELKNGHMVFGHNNGLTLYDRHTFKRVPFPDSKGKLTRVMAFMQDKEGNVWLAAHSLGFGQLKPDGTVKWYPLDADYSAVTIHQDASGRIWMGTNHELFYLKNDKLVLYGHNDKIKSPFRKIFSTANGEIVGTGLYGLYKISGDQVDVLPMTDSTASGSFYSYYQDKAGTEYAGASDGLYVIENGRIQKFNKGISIDNPVYFIFQDHEGNYWFGTNNGVLKWDGKNKLETYNLQNGLAGRETNRSAGMVDSQGYVWIGTDMGLSCFSPELSKLPVRVPVVKLLSLEDIRGDFHSLAEHCSINFDGNTIFFHFRGVSFVNEDQILYRYKLEGYDRDWQFVDQSDLDKVKYSGIQAGKYIFMVQARNGEGEWSEVAQSGTITVNAPFYHTWWFIMVMILLAGVVVYTIIKIWMQQKYRLKLENEILERKQSEQKIVEALKALHASELKYHDLIEFAVDGILIGRKDGIITGANTQMKQLCGRSEENLVGLNVNELFHLDMLSAVPFRYDLLDAGEIVVSRRSILRPDGTSVPVEMHTKMMPDGTYQSIYHDITDRIHAENAIKEKVNELARFNSLMVGRELKMIELKKEINELLMSLNKPEKYKVHD